MDKNTIIGLVIISILLIGYMFLSRPSKEEIAERQRVQDSIAHEQLVKEEEARVAAELLKEEAEKAEKEAAAMADTLSPEQIDSIRNIKLRNEHGIFAKSVVGENKFTVVENNKMIITFLNKGGRTMSHSTRNLLCCLRTTKIQHLAWYCRLAESRWLPTICISSRCLQVARLQLTTP